MMKLLPPQHKICYSIAFLIIGIVSRLIPHLPNSTAIIFSSLALGVLLPRSFALLLTLMMAIISDCFIAAIYHYPVYGYWSLFSFSGLMAIAGLGAILPNKSKLYSFLTLLGSSAGFWIWTNFGVWLCSNLYTKTGAGFIQCYIAALPFLRQQLLGDLIWLGALICAVGSCEIFRRGNFDIIFRSFNDHGLKID